VYLQSSKLFIFFSSNLINICWADGSVAACLDVLQITHAAISLVTSFLTQLVVMICIPEWG
jgi:prepilin-type processing-associated H-X9-DG protein